MTTSITDNPALGEDKPEAAFKRFDTVATAMQAAVTQIVEYNRALVDRGVAFTRDLAGAQNPAQAIQIETNYWISASEALASEMSRVGHLWAQIAQETMKSLATPIKQ